MSTAATVSAVTAANAATMAANSARNRAVIDACKFSLSNYNAQRATEPEMRQYASCVQLLHPDPEQPMSAGLEMALKTAIVLAIFGAALPWFRSGLGIADRLFLSVLFSIIVPGLSAVFVGLVAGAHWVLFG